MMLYNDVLNILADSRDLSIESSAGLLAAHATNLDSMWSDFRNTYYQEKAGGTKIPFNFSDLLREYINVSGKINDLVNKLEAQLQNCEQSSSIQFNLPELQLPKFNGKLNEWKRFIALFDRMVHNNAKIDHGMKIEYLKTSIKGQAAKIINHIDPNPDNYLTCYELLRRRFDNKREFLGILIDNILQLPKLDKENADLLKSMHDTVYEAIMSIKNIDVSTDNWDPLLCHILTRKLDSSTLLHYECQLKDVREPQTLPSLLAYLETRFMAMQSANIDNGPQ